MMITPETLRLLFTYEPSTGLLCWRPRPLSMFKAGRSIGRAHSAWNKRFANKEAFTSRHDKGYRGGAIFGKHYRAHRVIWAMETGSWPKNEIDHINRDTADNRFENLREATRAENAKNSTIPNTNNSGVCGVSFDHARKKWAACIGVSGRTVHLGRFKSMVSAIVAREAANIKYGFSPGHGTARIRTLRRVS